MSEDNPMMRFTLKLQTWRFFPKSWKRKVIIGAWWCLIEPLFIEIPLAGYILTKYEWEILGPINIILGLSTFFATIYGALCLGAGYIQWSNERFAKKPL